MARYFLLRYCTYSRTVLRTRVITYGMKDLEFKVTESQLAKENNLFYVSNKNSFIISLLINYVATLYYLSRAHEYLSPTRDTSSICDCHSFQNVLCPSNRS